MNNFFRALIAGYGAKKLGGGCLGTVLVFILIWGALGQCSLTQRDDRGRRNIELRKDERRSYEVRGWRDEVQTFEGTRYKVRITKKLKIRL